MLIIENQNSFTNLGNKPILRVKPLSLNLQQSSIAAMISIIFDNLWSDEKSTLNIFFDSWVISLPKIELHLNLFLFISASKTEKEGESVSLQCYLSFKTITI